MSDAGTHPTVALTRLAAGEVIAERYELRAPLGRGGMGVVWCVLDRELDEEIALKVLSAEHSETGEAQVRFRREVKLARRITHPNVARTYDLGRHGGLHYFTMELIVGESLGARMRRAALPLPEVLRVASEVCRGLAAAHAQGVVHRDLKPDNVMLAGERVVITDFGIARGEGDALATSGSIVGTPAYMAPEQLDARGIDGRADVYALGVVLFELVTGKLPFHGDTPFAMAAARLATPPPDPRSVLATVPDGIASLVLDMLATRREQRPDAQVVAERVDGLRGAGAAGGLRSDGIAAGAPVTPSALSSLDLGVAMTTGREGRTLRVDGLDASGEAATLGADLSQAMRDALSGERGVKIVAADADVVLGGELRVSQGRARVRLRLVGAGGATLWATRVEGDVADAFALEDSVVGEARAAVRARSGGRHGPPEGPLRERWQDARTRLGALDPRATREALSILEALERDAPGEASVQSLHALAVVSLWLQTGGTDDALAAQAEELALRALDADPDLADAYFAVARVRSVHGDYRAALRGLRETLARAPTFVDAHFALGMLLCDVGKTTEGLQRVEVARRLGTPGGSSAAMHLRVRALLGDETGVRATLASARGTPRIASFIPVMTELAMWWRDRDLAAEAVALMTAAQAGGAWEESIPLLRAFVAGEDSFALATSIFESERSARETPWHKALMGKIASSYYVVLGRDEEALRAIERAAAQAPCVDLLWFDRAPHLQRLRESPRFAAARAVVAARVTELGL